MVKMGRGQLIPRRLQGALGQFFLILAVCCIILSVPHKASVSQARSVPKVTLDKDSLKTIDGLCLLSTNTRTACWLLFIGSESWDSDGERVQAWRRAGEESQLTTKIQVGYRGPGSPIQRMNDLVGGLEEDTTISVPNKIMLSQVYLKICIWYMFVYTYVHISIYRMKLCRVWW